MRSIVGVVRSFGALGLVPWLLVVLMGRPSLAGAQSIVRSEVSGYVTSGGGAPLSGAFVSLSGGGAAATATLTTGRDGGFSFPSVWQGTYDVRFEALGFRPRVVRGVDVRSGNVLKLSIELERASPPVERVDTVGADRVRISTLRMDAGHRAPDPLLRRLPASTYDVGSFGSLTSRTDSWWGGQGMSGGETLLVVDGVPHRLVRHPLLAGGDFAPFLLPRIAVGELEVLSSPVDAEWPGGSGPIVSVHTERSFAAPPEVFGSVSAESLLSSPERGNGGAEMLSLWGGGRGAVTLVEDRSSLSFSVAGMRRRTPRVPLVPVDVTQALRDRALLGERLLDRLSGSGSEELDALSGVLRMDWSADATTSVSVRLAGGYYRTTMGALAPGGLGYGDLLPGSGTDLSAAFEVRTDVGGRFFFEGRAGVSRGDREMPGAAGLGTGAAGVPSTHLVGEGLTLGLEPGLEATLTSSQYFASGALHFREGGSRIKVGASASASVHEFDHLVEGSGTHFYSSVLDVAEGDGLYVRTIRSGRAAPFNVSSVAGFAEYTWDPTPNFRLLVGVEVEGEFLPTSGASGVGPWRELTGLERIPADDGLLKVGATTGFAWDPLMDGSTVVHGSLGVRHDRFDPAVLHEFLAVDGGGRVDRRLGPSAWPEPPPRSDSELPRRASFFGPDLRAPRTVAASVGVVSGLAGGVRFGLSGDLRVTDFLVRRADLNRRPDPLLTHESGRPVFGRLEKRGSVVGVTDGSNRRFPEYDVVWAFNTDGWSRYAGATATLERVSSNGLILFSSYTLSKTTDNLFGWSGFHPAARLVPAVAEAGGETWEESVSDFDVRHRSSVGVVVPLSSSERGSLTVVYRAASGRPFTPMVARGADVDGDGSAYNDVAVVPSEADLEPLAGRWDCVLNQAGRFAERNSCRTPWTHALDAGIELRILRVRGVSVGLRIDGLNLTESDSGLVDAALTMPDAEAAITEEAGVVSIPMDVNAGFGRRLPHPGSARILRASIQIGG